MKIGNLKDITGEFVKESCEWLKENDRGCCSVCYESDDVNNYAVCIGWHDVGGGEWKIAWKIGRQSRNSIMQSDFNVDFELPWGDSGDVDDTTTIIDPAPTTSEGWNEIATTMRKEARRVWRQWREDGLESD